MKIRRNPESSAGKVIIWLLAVAVFFVALVAIFVPIHNKAVWFRESPYAALGLSVADQPEPMLFESHIGGNWVIARGSRKWSTVIYYPNDEMTAVSARLVPVGGSPSPLVDASMFFYEVSAHGYEINNPSPLSFHKTSPVFDLFKIGPFVDRNPVFVGIRSQEIQRMVQRIQDRKAQQK